MRRMLALPLDVRGSWRALSTNPKKNQYFISKIPIPLKTKHTGKRSSLTVVKRITEG
jgi:hypothetical protein